MKKKVIFLLTVLLLVTVSIYAWFWGYYNHKSLDNIPTKTLMVTYLQEKGEGYASEKIAGYSLNALSEIWGEPDGQLFGMYGCIWESDGETSFIVYFDGNNCATNVKLVNSN